MEIKRFLSSFILVLAISIFVLLLQGCPITLPNQPPIAVLIANPTSGTVPLTVVFDGSSSYDPDGEIVSYEWDFGDGNADNGAIVTHSYVNVGSYTVTLTVTDNDGAVAQSSEEIHVRSLGGDIAPPELKSFTFEPLAIDVTTGPKEVRFRIATTDDLSGVSKVRVTFDDPIGTGQQNKTGYGSLVAGTPLNGEWEGLINFPELVANGTWTVHAVVLWDAVGNYRSIMTYELESRGFPTALSVTSNQDVTPPQLVSFTFVPLSIDTSVSSAQVEFTVDATDDLSGVSRVRVTFDDPTGTTQQNKTGYGILVSGTPINGQWKGTIIFPQYGAEGTWIVHSVVIWDEVGNYFSFGTDELKSRGFPTELGVSSNPDVTPPELISFDFQPQAIDTAESSQTITFTVQAIDNLSGVSKIRVTFDDPTGTTQQNRTGFAELISGSGTNGTWQGVVSFPQHSAEGTWVVHSVVLWDSIGNYQSIGTAELAARGFPTELTNGD